VKRRVVINDGQDRRSPEEWMVATCALQANSEGVGDTKIFIQRGQRMDRAPAEKERKTSLSLEVAWDDWTSPSCSDVEGKRHSGNEKRMNV